MKPLLPLVLLGLLAPAAFADTVRIHNSEIPAELLPFVSRLPGSYRIDNPWSNTQGVFELRLSGRRLTMESAVDISGRDCNARAVELVALEYFPGQGGKPDANAPLEAYFKLNKGSCPYIEGEVADFHFNKTIFNTDVYLIDVVIAAGTRNGRGQTINRIVQRWSLKKEE